MGLALTVVVPAATARAGTLPAPTGLHTSPASACPAKTPTIIGLGDVSLYAMVPSSLGSGAVQVTFEVTDASTKASVVQATVNATVGTDASFRVQQNVLETAAAGKIATFSWNASVSNGTDTSPVSETCSFSYDPLSPGTPTITETTSSYTVGVPAQFKISPAASGETPASYQYQVNGEPHAIPADSSGDATITLRPTRSTDDLTVTPVTPGGNLWDPATLIFTAALPPPAADEDLTGDGVPDLVTVGGTPGVPPGLWLASGQPAAGGSTGTGQIATPAVNIGEFGDGMSGDYLPTDFNGAQVITGMFSGANNFQSFMIYYPSGPSAGEGVVLDGTGDGSVVDTQDASNTAAIFADTFTSTDPYGDIPLQVANGYHADPNDQPYVPDLITVSGDSGNGYYLEYYQNAGAAGTYFSSVPLLSANTPDGTMDWSDWQISTTQDASGGVDMFLYDAATHALYLWTDFTVDDANATASYTPHLISSDWNPGTISQLRAADINGDGTPDLWTVTPDGVVTSWLVTGLDGIPAITSHDSAPLLPPTHQWYLSTADDGSGQSLPLTTTGNVTWQLSDQFQQAATFDGSTAALSTAAPAISTTGSFSVSAWVDPSSLSGTVLSESDTANPALAVWLSNGRWQAGITPKSSQNPVWTTATASNNYDAKQNTWTHVVVTYDASAAVLTLYLNGSKAASVATAASWTPAAGAFTLGALLTDSVLGKYFAGQIADVQVWDGTALSAAQAAAFTG